MTTFALVIDNQITSVGRLPDSARRLDTGEWVMGLATAPVALREATGWRAVVDTARPADTATTTHDRSVTLVNGTPTVTWTARAKTAAEQTADGQQANRTTIDERLDAALDAMRTHITRGTFTTTQRDQALLLVLRVCVGLVRLARNRLDGTD